MSRWLVGSTLERFSPELTLDTARRDAELLEQYFDALK